MPTAIEWSQAFARQAKIDWQTWEQLQTETDWHAPACHRLYFLQMACEKMCKAHLYRHGGNPSELQSSHAYTAKNLPILCQEHLRRRRLKSARVAAIMKFTKQIAREIELLAPSVDDGGRRPDNCEYPWVDGLDRLHTPAEWQFAVTELLNHPIASSLLKVISDAIVRLA